MYIIIIKKKTKKKTEAATIKKGPCNSFLNIVFCVTQGYHR